MGLDITAYRKLNKKSNPDLNDDGYNEDGLHVTRDVYDFSSAFGQGQPSGRTPATFYDYDDTMSFRAGSYGGYNEWRRELARLGGFEQIQAVWDKPCMKAHVVKGQGLGFCCCFFLLAAHF